jgi:hypothetical protein
MLSPIRTLCLACALLAPTAFADYEAHIFGGASFLTGGASDVATDGYAFGFGGVSRDGGALGWRWDMGFDFHDAREGVFPGRIVDDGNINTTFLRFGPQWNFEGYGSNFYVNLSAGYYWTYAYVSQYATVPGYICDPYWGWCWYAPVAGEFILADRSEDAWGYSATMGMEFDVVGGKWFVELQYHLAQHGDGFEFAPLVVGLRW